MQPIGQQQPSLTRPPVSSWLAETLRMTAFPQPEAPYDPTNWWLDIVGTPPEIQTSKPRSGMFRQEGIVDSAKFIINVEPTRLDLILESARESSVEEEGFRSIANFPEAIEKYTPLMLKCLSLSSFPVIHRLAFGAIVLQPVPDRIAGYQLLRNYLDSVKIDAENSSDFSYQINRRRPSKVASGDLLINRLTKWWVAVQRTGQIKLDSTNVLFLQAPETHACRLELDISNVPSTKILERELLPKLLNELVKLGVEIVQEGDIK